MYKFQQLRVYKLALEYVDAVYELSGRLPEAERFNLQSQLRQAATSIVLNMPKDQRGKGMRNNGTTSFPRIGVEILLGNNSLLGYFRQKKVSPASEVNPYPES